MTFIRFSHLKSMCICMCTFPHWHLPLPSHLNKRTLLVKWYTYVWFCSTCDVHICYFLFKIFMCRYYSKGKEGLTELITSTKSVNSGTFKLPRKNHLHRYSIWYRGCRKKIETKSERLYSELDKSSILLQSKKGNKRIKKFE